MNNIFRFRMILLPLQKKLTSNFPISNVQNSRCRGFLTYHNLHVNPKSRLFFTHCANKNNVSSEDHFSAADRQKEPLDINAITGGNPELEKKLKVLLLEVEIMRQEGDTVPSDLKVDHLKELINMETRSKRKRYLTFLFKTEMKKANSKKKKEERRKVREEELKLLKEQVDDGQIQYGLNRNTIFMRVYDATITQYDNYRLIRAMQFGQKLVVDCGYDSHMTPRECVNCAKQLMLLFSENRFHQDPFNLYFCNVNREGRTMKELHKLINTMNDDHFPLNINEESYLELFPKENLVYLTPHCREELVSFDHDAIYVIGGIVDKVNHEPLSLAKAKKEGLRMAKLPLDRYLSWGSGSGKSLTLNQMVQVLLDIRSTGDWETALRHVPRRKIVEGNERFQQKFYRKDIFREKFKIRKELFSM